MYDVKVVPPPATYLWHERTAALVWLHDDASFLSVGVALFLAHRWKIIKIRCEEGKFLNKNKAGFFFRPTFRQVTANDMHQIEKYSRSGNDFLPAGDEAPPDHPSCRTPSDEGQTCWTAPACFLSGPFPMEHKTTKQKHSHQLISTKAGKQTQFTSPELLRSWVTISLATNQRCSFITRIAGGSWEVPVPCRKKKTQQSTPSEILVAFPQFQFLTCRPNCHRGSSSHFQRTMEFVDRLSVVGFVDKLPAA